MLLKKFSSLYETEIRPGLTKTFGYKNLHQVPKLHKVVLSMGVGEAALDSKVINAAVKDLELISGQKAISTKAKKSIAAFKTREGMQIGCKVTLRRSRMYEFLERLVLTALPRIREFRGFSINSFDGRGNFSFGIKEQIVFPEIEYDSVQKVRGLNVTIVTSARSGLEGRALLEGFNLPFLAD
jgi:large subunit ribosomal protein L5